MYKWYKWEKLRKVLQADMLLWNIILYMKFSFYCTRRISYSCKVFKNDDYWIEIKAT